MFAPSSPAPARRAAGAEVLAEIRVFAAIVEAARTKKAVAVGR